MTPERFRKAEQVFQALQPRGGEVPLEEIAAVVSAWDPKKEDFSADTVSATFHACGATLGRVDRQAFYHWVYSLWSGLSDQVMGV